MTAQRFESVASIGGFPADQIAGMKKTTYEERGGLEVPKPLTDHKETVQRLFTNLLDAMSNDPSDHKFKRDLLLDEALMNQVLHGNGGDARLQSMARLTVERFVTETGVTINCILMLDDHSPPFQMEQIADPTEEENLDIPKGRGLLLIRDIAKATIAQIPRDGGKTMIYTWDERFKAQQEEAVSDQGKEDDKHSLSA